jgi:hypothetical protein
MYIVNDGGGGPFGIEVHNIRMRLPRRRPKTHPKKSIPQYNIEMRASS